MYEFVKCNCLVDEVGVLNSDYWLNVVEERDVAERFTKFIIVFSWLKNERNEVRNDLIYREIIDYRVWNGSCLRAVYVVI